MGLLFNVTCCLCVFISVFSETVNGKSFIEDLTLTHDQKIALDKFRDLVSSRLPHEYMHEDIYLIRWLRARNFNLQAAEKMLLDNLQWREEQRMDTILTEDWSDFRDYKYYYEGKDREGKPVLYIPVGQWDFRKVSIAGKGPRFLRFVDKIVDEGCSIVRDLGHKYHNVSQGYLIMSASGFSVAQHGCLQCVALILRIIFSYELHQPGCADKIIITHVPELAQPIVRAARVAFQPETNKAFFVYGTNPKAIVKGLSEDFDLDQLPPILGGTKMYKGSEDDYDS